MTCITKAGTYKLEVYDNEISKELQSEIWEHLLDCEFCENFYDHSHSIWTPRTDTFYTPRTRPAGARLPIAWDDQSLQARDPVVYKLWLEINKILENSYTIEGIQEGMNYMTNISPLPGITKPDGSPGTPGIGWRIYCSGNEREPGARTKAIHRDNPFVDQDQYFNIVYFPNQEWHPSWYGETLFHGNDATTGDYTGRYQPDQKRNFPIGDVENVVEPRPGRFMVYDARYLHQHKPTAENSFLNIGLVFRCKLK